MMTLTDWVAETHSRFKNNSYREAIGESVSELRKGIWRRSLDNWLGVPCWEYDWDVLIILDACRVDLWQDTAPEYGLPIGDQIWSPASCSPQWIARTFSDPRAANAGYVTGNPYSGYHDFDDNRLPVTHDDVAHLSEQWRENFTKTDYDVTTIPPDSLTNEAIGTWRNRNALGIDRLVVHYMQPHQPFRSRPEWWNEPVFNKMVKDGHGIGGQSLWKKCPSDEYPYDEIWEAYQDNLRWVLDDLTERLLKNIDANVVISADHGNAMGEFRTWGHPGWSPHPKVRRVPWVSVEANDSEEIEGTQTTINGQNGEDVKEKLEALGYA